MGVDLFTPAPPKKTKNKKINKNSSWGERLQFKSNEKMLTTKIKSPFS